MKWNTHLPPVGCWLVINVDGVEVETIRREWAQSRNDDMTFYTRDDQKIIGRFDWRYV
jgi:hypothetical protein